MNLKDLMMFYGVSNGIRYTKKQKEFFLNEVSKYCKENHHEYSFISKHSFLFNIASMVIGDLSKAKYVVVAPYDTLSKTILESNYYPFNPKKNSNVELINTILQIIITCVLGFVIYLLLRNFVNYSLLMKIIAVILTIIIVLFIYFFIKGFPNKVNLKRNSASVAILFYLLENVKNDNVAYVLSDMSSGSYEGAKLLKEHLGNQKVIYLDAISGNDKTIIAHRENIEVDGLLNEGYIERKYNENTVNVLYFFDRGIQISNGEIINKQLVVKNTRSKKDYDINMKELEKLADTLVNYLSK